MIVVLPEETWSIADEPIDVDMPLTKTANGRYRQSTVADRAAGRIDGIALNRANAGEVVTARRVLFLQFKDEATGETTDEAGVPFYPPTRQE